jgi:hypothetical protein
LLVGQIFQNRRAFRRTEIVVFQKRHCLIRVDAGEGRLALLAAEEIDHVILDAQLFRGGEEHDRPAGG